jgi:hypothetical protein
MLLTLAGCNIPVLGRYPSSYNFALCLMLPTLASCNILVYIRIL